MPEGSASRDSANALKPASTLVVTPRVAIIAGALVAAIFVAVFLYFFQAQITLALRAPADWGHTLIIPLISGYFIWLKREELLATPFRPGWFGILPIVVGLAVYFVGYLGPPSLIVHHNARGFGVGLAIFGLAILFFGWRAMTYLWFPLAYLVIFGQTISDGILRPVTERLQDISALGAHALLALVGTDVERDGNLLVVFQNGTPHPLNVAEACSGMRMLLAFLALGVAIAHTGLTYSWQKIILVAMGVPVAIGVNVLRVMTLGVLSLWDVNFATGEFHSMVGLVWLVPALLIYLGILWILRNLVIEDEAGSSPTKSSAKKPAKKAAANAV
ncbi:MAG: exosortase/archaeosortase family protein [Phycisphaerae bacterium]|nr:exosortase/archaeosortase family protein [Phycisphaerae bacterium]